MVLLHKLILVDSLILTAIHALKEARNNLFETIPQIIDLLLIHGVALEAFLIGSQGEHVLDQLILVHDAVFVCIDRIELLVQVQSHLLVVSFALDRIRTVNVDVVKVSGGRAWVTH